MMRDLKITLVLIGALAVPGLSVETVPAAATPAANGSGTSSASGDAMELTITGQSKGRLSIERVPPPAAFTIQDVQSFPKDLLEPVLYSSITLREASDFARLMDFRSDQPAHPWQPDIPIPPFIRYQSPTGDHFRTWEFSVIDQDGKGIYQKPGDGKTPNEFLWDGTDSERKLLGVDILYTPQLVTVTKENKRRTHLGTPIVFPMVLYLSDEGLTIEFSVKRTFPDNKSTLLPEANGILERTADRIRASRHQKLKIRIFDDEPALGEARAKVIQGYLLETLVLPAENAVVEPVKPVDVRGNTVQVIIVGAKGSAEE